MNKDKDIIGSNINTWKNADSNFSEFNSIKFSDYFLSIHKIKDSFVSVQISENGSIIAISNEQLININKE